MPPIRFFVYIMSWQLQDECEDVTVPAISRKKMVIREGKGASNSTMDTRKKKTK